MPCPYVLHCASGRFGAVCFRTRQCRVPTFCIVRVLVLVLFVSGHGMPCPFYVVFQIIGSYFCLFDIKNQTIGIFVSF